MKYFVCIAALIACVCAQVSVSPEQAAKYPHFYMYAKTAARHTRDVKDLEWDKKFGNNGRFFAKLGHDISGLFGKAGYSHQIFNDNRGQMNAQAYGSRVLGPYGDSTSFGGKVDWSDKNARAAIDLSKSVGGHTGIKATGEGSWSVDKSTRVSAGGFYEQPVLGHGRPDYGVQAQIQTDF